MDHSEIIFVVSEDAEGGYVAEALGHAIVTQADTAEELQAMVRDAVRCHFEEHSRPAIIRLHLVRDQVVPA
jgi:predicted RNase H-like HicB family nuclease